MKKAYLLVMVIMIVSLLFGCTEKIDDQAMTVKKDITTEKMLNDSLVNTGDLSRVIKAFNKAEIQKEITVAFIGGSITYGAGGSGDATYVKVVENWLKENFPDTEVTIINAGISGTDSVLGVHRLKEDVLIYKPDIVFVEFAVNDGVDENGDLKNIEQSYAFENIIRDVLSTEQEAAVIPVFCAVEGGYNSQKDKIKTASYYNLPMVSYLDAVMPAINDGSVIWDDITNDGIHPNKTGHRLLGAIITNLLTIVNEKIEDIYEIKEINEPFTKATYTNASMIFSNSDNVINQGDFENGTNHWIYKKGWSATGNDNPLVLEVDCKSLQIFVNKTNDNNGANFDIKVDQKYVTTISTKSTSTYEMLTSDIILDNNECELHTIEILLSDTNPDGCDGTNNEILSILISK